MSTTISFDHLLPEGLALKPFQTVGVAYASVVRRAIIGDEMGLGKTWQALVALLANNTFPAVVVCPASLKGNWARECALLLPNHTVQVLSGKNTDLEITADIVIVNYDILSAWADVLAQPAALIIDESHYAKNGKAARTKAVKALSESVAPDGLVIELTGTPVQNRPVELIEQLRIIGQLQAIAPRPKRGTEDRDWEFSYKFRFCGPDNPTGHGWEFKGSSNLVELNDKLRSTCLVRRERKDVLGLDDTTRNVVTLSLDAKQLKEYRKAEADIVAYKGKVAELEARIEAANTGEDADALAHVAKYQAEAKTLRAQVLVTLGTLRRLAGEAKIEATVEWVENFLDSNPTKSIVIFAWHKEVQRKLLEALADYNPARILGGQADVEAQKARFQAKETRVIVCSIKAASEGHTLTAASDVLFVEQPWHPGQEQQAEDRCNRLGQTEPVFAWKLLAEGTIDQWVHELIESKRQVMRAVVIGEAPADDDEGSITAALIERF